MFAYYYYHHHPYTFWHKGRGGNASRLVRQRKLRFLLGTLAMVQKLKCMAQLRASATKPLTATDIEILELSEAIFKRAKALQKQWDGGNKGLKKLQTKLEKALDEWEIIKHKRHAVVRKISRKPRTTQRR